MSELLKIFGSPQVKQEIAEYGIRPADKMQKAEEIGKLIKKELQQD